MKILLLSIAGLFVAFIGVGFIIGAQTAAKPPIEQMATHCSHYMNPRDPTTAYHRRRAQELYAKVGDEAFASKEDPCRYFLLLG